MRTFDRALSDGRSIRVRMTERSDGDFSITSDPTELESRRRGIVDRPWVWLDQVHGDRCVAVDALGLVGAIGAQADAAVARSTDCALSVQTADCVPVALWTEGGTIAAVHIGWRGLERGVLAAAIDAVRADDDRPVCAFIGPSIGPECYAFGEDELDRLVADLGPSLRSVTRDGRPALDVRAGVRSQLARLRVEVAGEDDTCTACDARFHSHRARAESERQAMVIWIEDT